LSASRTGRRRVIGDCGETFHRATVPQIGLFEKSGGVFVVQWRERFTVLALIGELFSRVRLWDRRGGDEIRGRFGKRNRHWHLLGSKRYLTEQSRE
jgi:hypothetical protein